MNKVFLILLLLFTTNAFSQQNRKSINLGFAFTNLTSKYYRWLTSDEGNFPLSQNGQVFFDVNYLFEKNIGKKFFIPIGAGINQKGFTEIGMSSTGGSEWITYEVTYSQTFLSFYTGLSYDLLNTPKYSLNIAQLICPELGSMETNRLVFSTRTNLSLRFAISNKAQIQLTPFFQIGLEDYEKSTLPNSSNWRPYGYGLTLGLVR